MIESDDGCKLSVYISDDELLEYVEKRCGHDGFLTKISNLLSKLENKESETVVSVSMLEAWLPENRSDEAFEINAVMTDDFLASPAANFQPKLFLYLKSSFIGRFYRKYFKKFRLAIIFSEFIWHDLYPLSLRFVSPLLGLLDSRRKWRSLISQSYLKNSNTVTVHKLAEDQLVHTPDPKVFPSRSQHLLKSPHQNYNFPEIFLLELENVKLHGGSNLLIVENFVVSHDLFDPVRDFTSEELHGRAIIDGRKNRIRWLVRDEPEYSFDEAASFVDACAPNYAHWMTEVLPRIGMFCSDKRFKSIPIIINQGLHNNILESLGAVIGENREVIMLPPDKTAFVKKLYINSVCGYVPFERRVKDIDGHSHGVFSPIALSLVKDCVLESINSLESVKWPDKIYIRRNSGVRRVSNHLEVEAVLADKGFAIVEPESMSFTEQAQMFSQAKVVIGSSGAALANMIFMPRGSKILILISESPDTSYWYWQNMACSTGNVVDYVLGFAKDNLGIHSDFSIRKEDLINGVNRME
ncbi:MAG: glycosyltransferase family 61 protein [Motiliproteus sp.]|nr:glycosyltransferase family 61 protein [Motiliproteus sp.]MCW9052533.1 glycosyltransferase family 61 protein [Motiliproteus sp.]